MEDDRFEELLAEAERLSRNAPPIAEAAEAAPFESVNAAPFDITPTLGMGGTGGEPLLLAAPTGGQTPEEVFATAYVRNGRDGAAAVRKAGLQDPRYDMDYVVRTLLARVDVQAYVAAAEALQSVNRDVRQYTREFFLHELQDTREKAMEANQFASAISATKLQAGLLGMLEQTVNINHSVSARELSLAELRAMVSRGMGDDATVVVDIGEPVRGIGGDKR